MTARETMGRRILIRVDAGGEIGAGHFMRCLTLADGLVRMGFQTSFISRRLPTALIAMLRERKHELDLLEPDAKAGTPGDLPHSPWLGTSQADDAAQLLETIADRPADWLLVDHYALDARWESAMRAKARRIFVIDDIANRRHDCDVLLDQNSCDAMDARYTGLVPTGCRLLLGPQYALLREEFAGLRETVRVRRGPVQRILVLMGGTDATNQTAKAINALRAVQGHRFEVDVVIGADHPALEEIQGACDAQGFQCHVQTNDVPELMARADLALGACGSTSWERCCLGLPAICVTVASNQAGIAKALAARGAILSLGDAAHVSEAHLAQAVRQLIDNASRLTDLSAASLALVDGKGTRRVCQALAGMQ